MIGNKERLQKLLILDKATRDFTFDNSEHDVPTYIFPPSCHFVVFSLYFSFLKSRDGQNESIKEGYLCTKNFKKGH